MVFDNIKNANLYFTLNPKFETAFNFIKKAVKEDLPIGKYEIEGEEIYAVVQEYDSKISENAKFEGHQNYIDIQYIISGVECIKLADISNFVSMEAYNPQKDVEFYEDYENAHNCIISDGDFGIFFAHDIHKPGLAVTTPSLVRKIVVKVKI